jgi:hypothetical protein
MEKLIKLKARTAVVLYILIDIFCVGAGMGVPIFCILLGFPLGWYIVKRISISEEHSRSINRRILKLALWASLVTFLLMAAIWGRCIPMIFNPTTDFKNFGHPFILFEPKASFIVWVILMIFISPFLQLLTTIFAAFITLIWSEPKRQPG